MLAQRPCVHFAEHSVCLSAVTVQGRPQHVAGWQVRLQCCFCDCKVQSVLAKRAGYRDLVRPIRHA